MIVVGNSIKEIVAEVADLQFLIDQNLKIGAVDIGNCFVQKQRLFSTAYFDFVTGGTSTTMAAGTAFDVFSYASGQQITTVGGSAAHFSFTATDADTNWPTNASALGVNQMFVGFEFGVDVGLALTTAANVTGGVIGSNLGGLPTSACADQIMKNIVYTVREGGQITSNYGLLYDYPAGIGASGTAGYAVTASTLVATHRDLAVQNGGPASTRKRFNVPQLWKPLVGYQHRLTVQRSAVLVDGVGAYASATLEPRIQMSTESNLIRIRCSWDGYLITAEV